MNNRILSIILISIFLSGGAVMAQSFYDFTLNDIDGKPVSLRTFEGKVLLAVNVASKCGFTKQYAGLEELYRTYKDSGLVILGFPANNFLSQEPGTDSEIRQFCTLNYNVTFPLFSKISVKGKDQAHLYAWLTSQQTSPEGPGGITWNFNKFLVNRRGEAVYRFGSKTEPGSEELIGAVKKLLAEPVPKAK